MTKIDSYSNYQELSREIGSDNITQSALKEAWQILEGVKKSGNSELLEKFTKEYIDIFSQIQEAKISHNEISISERQEILLELADMVNLAQNYQINEYKGKTRIANSLGNFFKGINPSEVKYQSLNLKDKNIDDYSAEDAIGALNYLNNNYSSYKDISERNEEKINQIVKSTFGYEAGSYNTNISTYTSNYQYLENTNSEFNGFTSYDNDFSPKTMLGLDQAPVRACKENNFNSIFFDISEDDVRKGLTFNYHTINELDDKYEVRLFQELAVKKALGKERNVDLDKNGFNDKYIHGFNNEKGNFLIEAREMNDLLYYKNNVSEINSKALANYIFYLKEKGNLTPEYLVKNIHPSNLMALGKLWSQDDNTDESKNRLIARDTITSAGGEDFVNLVAKFKDIESIKTEFERIVNSPNPGEEISNISECYKIFLKKAGKEISTIFVESLKDKIEEAKARNNGMDITPIIAKFEKDLAAAISEDIFDYNKVLKLVNDFSLNTRIDASSLKDTAFEAAKANNDIKLIDLILEYQRLIHEREVLSNQRKALRDESRHLSMNEYSSKLLDLNKQIISLETQLTVNKINETQFELIGALPAEDLIRLDTGKISIEDLIAEKVDQGDEAIIKGVKEQSRLLELLEKTDPEYVANSKSLSNAIASKETVKEVYISYYNENIATTNNTKTKNSTKSSNTIDTTTTNNIQSSLNYSGYYPETKINISRGMGGEYYVQSKTEDKKFPITQQESELISQEPKYRENFSNFLETVNELGLEEFWDYREDLFKTIDNLIGGTAFKENSEKLNDLDMIRFLSTIVKSYGVEPKNRTLGELKLQVKELNFGSSSENDVIRNSRGESNIFSNFKEKFIDEGIFRQLDFEKFLLNPNSNNKTGIEQQIS